MTIKELKEKLIGLPEDLEIGSSGHFGEFLQCYGVYVEKLFGQDKNILHINIEAPGEEPE